MSDIEVTKNIENVLTKVLGSAIKPGTVTILKGAPGTGKTSLLINALIAMEPIKNHCFVILSRQNRENFKNHLKDRGCNEDNVKAIQIYDKIPSLDEPFDELIEPKITNLCWDFIAVDSATDIIAKSKEPKQAEQKLGNLLDNMRQMGSVIVATQEDSQNGVYQPIEFMADNVIELRVEGSVSGHFDRHLRVIKSCKASNIGEYILFIDNHGIPDVIDIESIPANKQKEITEESERQELKAIPTGIEGLDEMLVTKTVNGTLKGFVEGTTILISGSPGSRKSLCGLFFLSAEKEGPTLLISTREQKERLFKAQVPILLTLDQYPEKHLKWPYPPGHTCLSEIYVRIETEINKGNRYKRVVINTISDFAQMSADSHHFEDILFKLIQLLNRNGTTVLLILDSLFQNYDGPLNNAKLLSFIDTHIEMSKAVIAYMEHLTFKIAKHWGIDYDPHIKELVLEDDKLKVLPSFQMFVGLRDGEPQLLDINLKLIAENKAELAFGQSLEKECKFLVGSDEQVKADYYSSAEIVEIVEACQTSLPFLRKNALIAMVDEPWVNLVIKKRKKELAKLYYNGFQGKELKEEYFNGLTDNCINSNGTQSVYALPLYSDVGLFCVNRKYVKTMDKIDTWERVKKAIKEAKAEENKKAKYGFLINVFLPDTVASFVLELIWGYDETCFWENNNEELEIETCKKALEFIGSLVEEEITPSYSRLVKECQKKNGNSQNGGKESYETEQKRFCQLMTEAAFFRTWYSQLVYIKETVQDLEFDVSVIPVPKGDVKKGGSHSILGPWYIIGFAGPASDAVATIVRELCTPEKERRRFLSAAGLPVRNDIAKQFVNHHVKYTDLTFGEMKSKLLDKGRLRSYFGDFIPLRNVLFDSAVIIMDNPHADATELAKNIMSEYRRTFNRSKV